MPDEVVQVNGAQASYLSEYAGHQDSALSVSVNKRGPKLNNVKGTKTQQSHTSL